jgi:hypothetical protein
MGSGQIRCICAVETWFSYFRIGQLAALKYTFGEEVITDPYHIPMIRTVLNKKLAACFPDIHDEIVQSFEDVLALEGNGEWKAVPALTTMLRIVCRTSNRLFVGLPLCRLVNDVSFID